MDLRPLFRILADTFNGPESIERHAARALLDANAANVDLPRARPLPSDVLEALVAPDALPVCAMIQDIPFDWAPPDTSADPLYIQHSQRKVHVELLGPDGLVHSDAVRLGLYGMRAHAEYGLRTHPAEEIYVMLAGQSFWMRGNNPYQPHGPAERSYHPSFLPHASKTERSAFLSIYAWRGDLSKDDYVYAGLPDR